MVLTVLLQLWVGQVPGCVKDTDCKGDRICEAGVCVSPPPASAPLVAPPPPPAPAPAPPTGPPETWPRVVRRDGLICVQSLGEEGQVEESCRRDDTASQGTRPRPSVGRGHSADYEPTPPRPPVAEEPGARFVADVLFQGGLSVLASGGASVTLPQLNGFLALGARFRSGVGVVGVGSLAGAFAPGFGMVMGTVAPGLRFGNRGHFILAAGASVLGYSGGGTGGSGVMGSVLTQGVFAVAGPFVLALHGGLHFDASGVLLMLGAGLGFGAL